MIDANIYWKLLWPTAVVQRLVSTQARGWVNSLVSCYMLCSLDEVQELAPLICNGIVILTMVKRYNHGWVSQRRVMVFSLIIYFERNIGAVTQYENTSASVLIIPLMHLHHEKLFKVPFGNSSVDSWLKLNSSCSYCFYSKVHKLQR